VIPLTPSGESLFRNDGVGQLCQASAPATHYVLTHQHPNDPVEILRRDHSLDPRLKPDRLGRQQQWIDCVTHIDKAGGLTPLDQVHPDADERELVRHVDGLGERKHLHSGQKWIQKAVLLWVCVVPFL
jgi:hypothetical protein